MKILKIEDGMELKVVPIIRRDGSSVFSIPISALYFRSSLGVDCLVYDEGYFLKNFYFRSRLGYGVTDKKFTYVRRWIIFVWHDGELKMSIVSRSIIDIISKGLSSYDFRGLGHLKIVECDVTKMCSGLVSYERSYFFNKYWEIPVSDVSGWDDLLRRNDIDDYLFRMGVMNNLGLLNSEFNNSFSHLISDSRNRKLEELGI